MIDALFSTQKPTRLRLTLKGRTSWIGFLNVSTPRLYIL